MRSIIAGVIVLASLAVCLQAQESAPDSTKSDPMETVISTEIESNGGFGAVVFKVGNIDGSTGVIFGGRGGWVINRTLVIGGGGYGWLQGPYHSSDNQVDTNLAFAYGGFEIEYLIASNNVVHASIIALIGGGGVSILEQIPQNGTSKRWDDIYSTGVFVFEPAANVEVTLLPWLRIAAGLGYRVVSGVDIDLGGRTYDNSSVSGLFGVGTIKFGSY